MEGPRDRSKGRLLAILIASAIIVSLIATTLIAPYPSEGDPPAQNIPARITYTVHAPISINGNAEFNDTNGVVSGNGTISNPYVISGWDITQPSSTAFQIKNTNAYFIVRDCYVHHSVTSIYLFSCVNGIFENNTCSNSQFGIYLLSSSSITLSNNTYNSNLQYGIRLQSSNSNIISNNTCNSNNLCSIILLSSSGNKLSNNNCSSNWGGGGQGIRLETSNNNVISWNEMRDNPKEGVYIASGSLNRIWNNTFINNNGSGVQAYDAGTNNWWNTSGSPHGYGNYWDDLTTPDTDFDGVVDWSYNLTGSAGAKDWYPLTDAPFIPEFSDALIPIVGLMLIALVFGRKRKA